MHPLHVQGASVNPTFSDEVQVVAGAATVSIYFGSTISGSPAIEATANTAAMPAIEASNKLHTRQVVTKGGALTLLQDLAKVLNYTITPSVTPMPTSASSATNTAH